MTVKENCRYGLGRKIIQIGKNFKSTNEMNGASRISLIFVIPYYKFFYTNFNTMQDFSSSFYTFNKEKFLFVIAQDASWLYTATGKSTTVFPHCT